MDRTEGIVARFRTMPISPASILGGHVLGSLVQSLLGMAANLLVAILLGFRPRSVETASNTPTFLMICRS